MPSAYFDVLSISRGGLRSWFRNIFRPLVALLGTKRHVSRPPGHRRPCPPRWHLSPCAKDMVRRYTDAQGRLRVTGGKQLKASQAYPRPQLQPNSIAVENFKYCCGVLSASKDCTIRTLRTGLLSKVWCGARCLQDISQRAEPNARRQAVPTCPEVREQSQSSP